MKNTALIIMFVTTYVGCFAQSFDGIATYKTKLAEDNFSFVAQLFFNKQKSIYVTKQNEALVWKVSQNTNEFEADEGLLVEEVYTDSIGHLVINEIRTPSLSIRDFCQKGKPIIFNDMVNIKWTISQKQRKIGELKCQKAYTRFRGRKYEVWFAIEIPVPYGPWKFHGLPGLIVELYDQNQEVHMKLASVSLENTVQNILLSNGLEQHISLSNFYSCLHTEWEKEAEITRAKFAQLQAKYPSLEIELESPESRPATELEFE